MTSLQDLVCKITNTSNCELGEVVQSLWSGYGVIQRVKLDQSPAIMKHIDISEARDNRRGWGTKLSHQRKVRSYQIEITFYQQYATRCSHECRVPKLIATHEKENESGWVVVLEDLDSAGFDLRKSHVNQSDIHACLRWLANFHATFMNCEPEGLWPVGTYWHLETRPEEWNIMEQSALKDAAGKIDDRLNNAKFKTLVHGDAKLANFCFGREQLVAAVDFQYVGGGCGMKDVAYFISSCLNERESESQQDVLLDFYFQQLQQALARLGSKLEFAALEKEWRELYPFAWADFCRFLAGWSPGHWKINGYSQRVTQSVIDQV